MSSFLQQVAKFYQNNKELSVALIGLIPTILLFFWWLKWRNRQRKIPPNLFAFQVIAPQTENLKREILGGKDNDPFADRNITYQQRIEGRNTQRELREHLETHRWLLILGKTGIGKTREALEVAEDYNQQGWTVLFLKPNEWLDIPAKMPGEIPTDRKLLFVIDDLNRKMHRSRKEISPEAEKSPVEKFTVPLQERLLDALTRYEEFCGQVEVRVIATARNEREADSVGEISPWEQLQWEKYPKLWGKFQVYELPQPSDDAVIGVLTDRVQEAGISADTTNYSEIARRNDATFRNVVENLRRIKANNLPLNTNNYRDTLRDTWKGNYQKAIKRYPHGKYVYEGVDLLRQFNISLYDFTVLATAKMLAGGNIWQQLVNFWKIKAALRFLIASEEILEPRDGQIEAKGYEVDKQKYIQHLLTLILELANQHPEKILDSLFYFGNALVNLGRYEEAIASYDKALDFKPDYHEAWNNRGVVLGNLGRYEEAIASYDKALDIKPDDDAAWNNRGNALVKLGRNEEAIASYDKALDIKPDDDAAWNNRGNALVKLGRYEEAIASYDKALDIKHDFDEAWYNRGYALVKLGRYEEAIASWDKALEFKPDDHAAWYNRGIALDDLGKLEEAIASFDKALDIKPDDNEAWFYRGIVLDNLEQYEEAIASWDKALEFKPDKDEAWFYRGIALGNLEKYEETIASFDKALEIQPDDDEAWFYRGIALGNLEKYEEAIASFDKALEIQPDDDEAWYNRGVVLGNLGRYEEAIASYDKALDIKPDDDATWYNRGVALDNLGRLEEAIASYDKALEFKPDDHTAWDNRGYALLKQGKFSEAIQSHDRAIEISPEYENAWYNRACVYGALNNIDSAIENLQQAINLDPEYREMAKTDTDFDSIRDDGRFQDLINQQ